jgi:integrase
MVEYDWCRSYINKQVVRIKAVFRWAAENELIPGGVYHALRSVTSLRKGRCGVRESESVRPVTIECVNAVRPFVSRQVWALIQLQLFSGARAGELVCLRPCDMNTTGGVWAYQPDDHKTAHHGHRREIHFGPRSQEVLKPFLNRRVDAYMFSPREAETERRAQAHARRRTRLSCGNTPGSNKKPSPQRPAGDRYDTTSYRRAIARACDKAFPPPEELARRKGETVRAWKDRLTDAQKQRLDQWQRDRRWHPHQIRHTAGTELRREFGIEVARIVLGHRSAAITEVYAELDQAKAHAAMAHMG